MEENTITVRLIIYMSDAHFNEYKVGPLDGWIN